MLEGMIIGAVVGFIVSMVMLLTRRNTRKALLATLQQHGLQAAAVLLDQKIPPATKIALRRIIPQRERMAGLAIIELSEVIERELPSHSGALTAVTQVNAIGLLGIVVRGDDPAEAAGRLDQLAGRMESEGGAALKLVKKKIRALATLAASVASGARLDGQTRMTLDTICNDGGMVQLVIWQALRRALVAAGQDDQAQTFAGKVQALTTAFDPDLPG